MAYKVLRRSGTDVQKSVGPVLREPAVLIDLRLTVRSDTVGLLREDELYQLLYLVSLIRCDLVTKLVDEVVAVCLHQNLAAGADEGKQKNPPFVSGAPDGDATRAAQVSTRVSGSSQYVGFRYEEPRPEPVDLTAIETGIQQYVDQVPNSFHTRGEVSGQSSW